MKTVLAIETSCDETAVAVVRDRTVLSSVVASQINIHQRYGGVVPEVASRAHVENLGAVTQAALTEAGVGWPALDGIAATCAPGLVGALMVGMTAGKTLAMLYDKPFIGVHHLEGHIYAAYLSQPELQPPYLCLLVSGGHTSFIYVKDCGIYEQLGKTRDDAAGEAFDKVARLLDLGYPGGPIIDRLAVQGDSTRFQLPEGNISLPEGGFHPYDCSFSGLKTAMLRLVQNLQGKGIAPLPIADLCASFQATVARGLTKRAIRCASDHDLTTIALGGGVAANSGLRAHLSAAAAENGLTVLFPPLQYCTDNAAMIGCAAADHLHRGHVSDVALATRSRMDLSDVMTLYR
ncbi:MAG: tRNA (adenosine(37)-N6)-threonylcarbamoyltransferase complex transferase subunit TsaD [Leptolyngbyaceae cyanobacterium]